jgi:hypothetical protein
LFFNPDFAVGIVARGIVYQEKNTTRCRAEPDVMFWGLSRKLRDGNQEEKNEKTKTDDFVKSHQICFRWLSKNFDIQGEVIFQVRDNTYGMSSA